MSILTRRQALQLTAGAGLAGLGGLRLSHDAFAEAEKWRHGMSLFGDLKYGERAKHFDYVNPDAPKTGRARIYGIGSFDSLNPFTFKGTSAGLVGLTFDTLFATALDEPSSMYGHIASQARYPDDYSSVTFRLDPRARFHDGKPVTPEDVIWSLQALKSSHPRYAFYYKNIDKAEQTGEREVTFHFSSKGNRELPHITAQLIVLPKHWWLAKSAKGEARDIKKTKLDEPLLGSGAYKIKDYKPGDWIVIERVKDYWAADLAAMKGQNNFDEIKQVYFRDQSVALEAFKGDQYDWREENNSKVWATQYKFPAVKKGRVIVEKIPQKNSQGMQAFIFNLRRKKFADARVRQAFNYAFDFEWSNKNLFFGQYTRTNSFFSNSELAAKGLPDKNELAILNQFKGQIPEEVFTTPYTNPTSKNPAERRNNLRQAARLLRAAGWKPGKDRVLRNKDGERLEFEIMLVSPAFERIVLPYAKQLRLLGVQVSVRTIDAAQYVKRLETFDYDCIIGAWGQSLSPGNEQRGYWQSASADRKGSKNYIGLKNPVVDKLVERLIFAKNRTDLVAATRALDRVLLWNHYVVPTWHIAYDRTARWNRFGRPEKLPDFSTGFPAIWWWDEAKAAATKAKK